MPARGAAGVGLEALTRRHACKLCLTIDCSVEDCVLAVGEIVGYDSIKSASRMNNGVVIFVDSVDKVAMIVEQGVEVKDTFVQAVPLVSPAKRIVLSQVPPFIGNEMLARELSRHGTISLGCKSPQLKHVVSFRRQVFMILKDNEELNLVLKFRVEDYDYSKKMKCFGCGIKGHLIRSCPELNTENINRNVEQGESNKSQEKDKSSDTQRHVLSKANATPRKKQHEQNVSQGQKLNEAQGVEQDLLENHEQKTDKCSKSQKEKLSEQNDPQEQKQIEPTENQGLKQKELSVLQENDQNVSDKGKRTSNGQLFSLAENSPQESEMEREVSSGAQKDMERAGCSVVDDSEMLVDDTSKTMKERENLEMGVSFLLR
ncbi:Transposon TX1 uncharacterized 82 kDa protein [Labeo rohita]|uniref:Transposon TX1 uncharacterized 82 kDa protein n=1 Tax=Labeo rohita TaxID=84645 RepID=A0ABQ8LY89_LABRO|nr:Transposon TX1 uncharacterized 82 kDa protein [Labeo rohita]